MPVQISLDDLRSKAEALQVKVKEKTPHWRNCGSDCYRQLYGVLLRFFKSASTDRIVAYRCRSRLYGVPAPDADGGRCP